MQKITTIVLPVNILVVLEVPCFLGPHGTLQCVILPKVLLSLLFTLSRLPNFLIVNTSNNLVNNYTQLSLPEV